MNGRVIDLEETPSDQAAIVLKPSRQPDRSGKFVALLNARQTRSAIFFRSTKSSGAQLPGFAGAKNSNPVIDKDLAVALNNMLWIDQ